MVFKPTKKGRKQSKREKEEERAKTKQRLKVSNHANLIQPNVTLKLLTSDC